MHVVHNVKDLLVNHFFLSTPTQPWETARRVNLVYYDLESHNQVVDSHYAEPTTLFSLVSESRVIGL